MDILVCEEISGAALQQLAAKYAITAEPELWRNPAELEKTIRHARTIMIRNQTRVTEQLLAKAEELIGIGRVGVGLDNIDLEAATRRGVVVVAPLNANAVSVAELTLGLLLSLARKIPVADRSVKNGAWNRKGCTGIELADKTLAICGFGRIGRLVAVRARAFGLRLVVFDPFVKEDSPALAEVGATFCKTLAEALDQSDFVTVHSPLTKETRHMFNRTAFAAMRPGAFFINTSRGGIVEEEALLSALSSGQVAGAALDVREHEPPGPTSLDKLDNVILTPHIAAFTSEAQARALGAVCEDLDRLLGAEPAVNFINLSSPRPALKPEQISAK